MFHDMAFKLPEFNYPIMRCSCGALPIVTHANHRLTIKCDCGIQPVQSVDTTILEADDTMNEYLSAANQWNIIVSGRPQSISAKHYLPSPHYNPDTERVYANPSVFELSPSSKIVSVEIIYQAPHTARVAAVLYYRCEMKGERWHIMESTVRAPESLFLATDISYFLNWRLALHSVLSVGQFALCNIDLGKFEQFTRQNIQEIIDAARAARMMHRSFDNDLGLTTDLKLNQAN